MRAFAAAFCLVAAAFTVGPASAAFSLLEGSFVPCNGSQAANTFKCVSDGLCVDATKRCDGTRNCDDGSDEVGCGCTSEFFRCETDGSCVSKYWRCDGQPDCQDHSDEKGCAKKKSKSKKTKPVTCSPQEFTCAKSGLCIPAMWKCDGRADCDDESDEASELCSDSKQVEAAKAACDGFSCTEQPGLCIPSRWRCDGSLDCPNGSDESWDLCAHIHRDINVCRQDMADGSWFLCNNNKTCIRTGLLCDGLNDCEDKSDEGGLCSTACNSSMNCPSGCRKTPSGGVCICENGFRADPDGQCRDIDECKESFGACSQICVNTEGSYTCKCDKDYVLHADGHTCSAEHDIVTLFFSTQDQVRRMELSGAERRYSPVTAHMKTNMAVGVAYDSLESKVYWSAMMKGQEGILFARQNGNSNNEEPQYLISTELASPEDLAIDYIARNIYFTDAHHKIVGVCSLSSRDWTPLISTSMDKPRAIALYPEKGIMIYTDWGAYPRINKASMDGTNINSLVTGVSTPNGVTIDKSLDRVFWCDAERKSIESVKLDGSDRRILIQGSVMHPFSIAVFESLIYVSDWKTQEVVSMNKFTGKNWTALVKESKIRPMGISVYHPLMESLSSPNPCRASPCSHICLLNSVGGRTCKCPRHMVLESDRETCRLKSAAFATTTLKPILYGQDLFRFPEAVSPLPVPPSENIHPEVSKFRSIMRDGSLQQEVGEVIYGSHGEEIIVVHDQAHDSTSTIVYPVTIAALLLFGLVSLFVVLVRRRFQQQDKESLMCLFQKTMPEHLQFRTKKPERKEFEPTKETTSDTANLLSVV